RSDAVVLVQALEHPARRWLRLLFLVHLALEPAQLQPQLLIALPDWSPKGRLMPPLLFSWLPHPSELKGAGFDFRLAHNCAALLPLCYPLQLKSDSHASTLCRNKSSPCFTSPTFAPPPTGMFPSASL